MDTSGYILDIIGYDGRIAFLGGSKMFALMEISGFYVDMSVGGDVILISLKSDLTF